jgi:hypothetical protein
MMTFGIAQHLISAACGELGADGRAADREFGVASQVPAGSPGGRAGQPGTPGYQRYRPGVRGLRDRVAHLLDVVSGPAS